MMINGVGSVSKADRANHSGKFRGSRGQRHESAEGDNTLSVCRASSLQIDRDYWNAQTRVKLSQGHADRSTEHSTYAGR